MSEPLEQDPLATDPPRLSELIDVRTLAELTDALQRLSGLTLRIIVPDDTNSGPIPAPGVLTCELPVSYDGRELGRLIAWRVDGAPTSLEALVQQAQQAARAIEVVLYSGHRAHLTGAMHMIVADESYRELSEKNERLQHAYDRLKELDRLKSTFLATMSHELRTPLTSIIGYSEMLANGMGGPITALQREFVDTIRARGDHLLELIVSLLDVAKLEQDQITLHRAPLAPRKLADDVLRTVSPAAAKKGIKLERRIADDLPVVRADEARLRQVLLNLMDNAVKFTPKGGRVTLELSPTTLAMQPSDDAGLVLLAAPEPAVQFAVRDTGIGIPSSEHERIFDAFYQVDGSPTREHGGTGLGLAIVKRLVEAHGGTIQLASATGRGTEFRVRIPAAPTD